MSAITDNISDRMSCPESTGATEEITCNARGGDPRLPSSYLRALLYGIPLTLSTAYIARVIETSIFTSSKMKELCYLVKIGGVADAQKIPCEQASCYSGARGDRESRLRQLMVPAHHSNTANELGYCAKNGST